MAQWIDEPTEATLRHAIFESTLPGWSTMDAFSARVQAWKLAGFDTVFLQVDAGTGACWDSTIVPADPRVDLAQEPLRRQVDACHDAGLAVVLVFSTALHATWLTPSVRPEYVGTIPSLYSFWNADFRAWKSDVIAECVRLVDADGVALDYLRTGREAQGDEASAASVLADFLRLVRGKLDGSCPLMNLNNAVYAQSKREGVEMQAWLDAGLIDQMAVFEYGRPFPAARLSGLDASRLWVITGNYTMVNGTATPQSGLDVAKAWRQVRQSVSPYGVGLYLANLLTDEQARHVRYVAGDR